MNSQMQISDLENIISEKIFIKIEKWNLYLGDAGLARNLALECINMTGKVADLLVSEVNITANKNTVPFDPESPFVTSGLRLGTAALTTRGFNDDAFVEVGEIIADRLLNPDDLLIEKKCKERVLTLCNRFPLYEFKLEASIK